jgi:hypothetical protein
MSRVHALDPPAQVSLEGVAVSVHEARGERPARETLALRGRAYPDDAAFFDRDAHTLARAVRVEHEVR